MRLRRIETIRSAALVGAPSALSRAGSGTEFESAGWPGHWSSAYRPGLTLPVRSDVVARGVTGLGGLLVKRK
jgi:hypothetical protein